MNHVRGWLILFVTILAFFVLLSGDNFFKSATYSIEAVCAAPFTEQKEDLRAVEAQILTKRVELSKFESEYREVGTLILAVHLRV